jgi:hypothetical protein
VGFSFDPRCHVDICAVSLVGAHAQSGGAHHATPILAGPGAIHRLREPSRIQCPHLRLGKAQNGALTADDIDCIIAYIVPLDLWYVLPVESFSPCKNLWLYPNGSKKGSRFESFREAWWLDPELKEM